MRRQRWCVAHNRMRKPRTSVPQRERKFQLVSRGIAALTRDGPPASQCGAHHAQHPCPVRRRTMACVIGYGPWWKDEDAIAGWPVTAGSALMKDNWRSRTPRWSPCLRAPMAQHLLSRILRLRTLAGRPRTFRSASRRASTADHTALTSSGRPPYLRIRLCIIRRGKLHTMT
jgi:hypothetical protein